MPENSLILGDVIKSKNKTVESHDRDLDLNNDKGCNKI